MQNFEDTETKFKWDTNQISNDDYLAYTRKRRGESSDGMDQIRWDRAINGVETEIRSDYRAEQLLQLSLIPGNSSDEVKQKAQMYANIAQMAYNDGDNDAYISAMTQFNNAVDQYRNKLESEAKAGAARQKKELNKIYNESKNVIDLKRAELAGREDLSPDEKAAALSELDSEEMKLNIGKLSWEDDEVSAGNIMEKMTKLQTKIVSNGKFLEGQYSDQNGNPIQMEGGIPIPGDGQFISGFKASYSEDIYGEIKPLYNKEKYDKYIDKNGKVSFVEKGSRKQYVQTQDADGNWSLVDTGSSVDINKAQKMRGSDNQEYYSEYIKTSADQPMQFNADGTTTKPDETNKPDDIVSVLDENGEELQYNPNTKDFSSPLAPAGVTEAANAMANAGYVGTGDARTRKMYLDRDPEYKAAVSRYIREVDTLGGLARFNREQANEQILANNDMVIGFDKFGGKIYAKNSLGENTGVFKENIAKFGKENVMPSSVNPLTKQYIIPKNYPAPYNPGTPSVTERQIASNVVSPQGIMGQIFPNTIGKQSSWMSPDRQIKWMQNTLNVNKNIGWGDAATRFEKLFGKIQGGSEIDKLLRKKYLGNNIGTWTGTEWK